MPFFDPTVQAFLDAMQLGSVTTQEGTIHETRARLEAMQASTNPSLDSVDYETLDIPVGPTGSVNIHIYKPKGHEGLVPTLIYIHGGGWMMGNNITHQRIVMDLMEESGAGVFFINYTLCPEVVYPVPIEQSYAAIQWLYENGKSHGLNPEKVALAGESAGASISIGVTLLALQRQTPVPKYMVLFVPVTDISKESRTYKLFPEGPIVVPSEFQEMIKAWTPDASRRTEILASPLLATKEDLKGFPETLILVAETDPLREEGEQFGRNLIAAGINTTIFRSLAVIHGVAVFNAFSKTPAARAEIELAGLKIKRALL